MKPRKRPAPRPNATTTNPHTQLTQNAPSELQERVFEFARSLSGVVVGPSLVIASGWAERHPLAGKHGLPNNIVMVYGPRDENELAVVKDLVRASHELAAS